MQRLILCLLLTCFSILTVAQQNATEYYIQAYHKIARKEMKRSGIPASITLAQGILESGSGQSKLARKAKNHFGIKCADNWYGRRVYMDDDKENECFRRYRKVKFSYRDHSNFIRDRKRYAFLFELPSNDYKGWAEGLKKAGYATNPNYPSLLVNLIEKYDLQQYDGKYKPLPTKTDEPRLSTKTYRVKKGDTMYSIARKKGVTVEQLQQWNGKNDYSLQLGEELKLGN